MREEGVAAPRGRSMFHQKAPMWTGLGGLPTTAIGSPSSGAGAPRLPGWARVWRTGAGRRSRVQQGADAAKRATSPGRWGVGTRRRDEAWHGVLRWRSAAWVVRLDD